MSKDKKLSMEELTSYAKRRGFVFQASEMYGGIGGFWDLGPYGAELADNIKASWWKTFVYKNPNVVGINSSIIQNTQLWKASGHVDTFVDPMVDCKECKHRFRADHVAGIDTTDLKKLDEKLKETACPNCGARHSFTPARTFQMMFKTYVGPIEDDANVSYLRPETAGGIFAQYENVRETTRKKLPFGIAQIGKAFRNEITPGDFIFRLRELTQMELEFFTKPKEAGKQYEFWKEYCMQWLLSLGLNKENLRYHDHADDERAHYAEASVDVQYNYPFGFKELYGIANRTDYDLSAHAKQSGKDLTYFDEETGETLWEFVLPAGSEGIPAMYEAGGRQFLVVSRRTHGHAHRPGVHPDLEGFLDGEVVQIGAPNVRFAWSVGPGVTSPTGATSGESAAGEVLRFAGTGELSYRVNLTSLSRTEASYDPITANGVTV